MNTCVRALAATTIATLVGLLIIEQSRPIPGWLTPAGHKDSEKSATTDHAELATTSRVVGYPNLNVSSDAIRVQVGALPAAWQFGYLPVTPAFNASTAAITGAVATPAGTYTGDPFWPDMGVAGYALSYNTNKAAIGVFGFGGIGVNGGFTQSFNGVVTNCELSKPSCAEGGGYDFSHIYGAEVDLNLYSRRGSTNPTGHIRGYLAMLSAAADTVSTLSSSFAFMGATQGSAKWAVGYMIPNGSANVFASIGAVDTTGPSDSQAIYFNSITSSNAARSAVIKSSSEGDLLLINSAGSASFGLFTSYPALRLSQPTGGASGMRLSNPSTGKSVQETFILETGAVNSHATIGVTDGSILSITAGEGLVIGVSLTAKAGAIAIESPINAMSSLNVKGIYNANGTPGVNCAPGTVNPATMTVTNGIVTRC